MINDIPLNFLASLLNNGYLKYEQITDKIIEVDGCSLRVDRDDLGQIINLKFSDYNDFSFYRLVKHTSSIINYNYLMRIMKRSILNKKQYMSDCNNIFIENNIESIDEIFNQNNSSEYKEALVNRINNKDYIEKHYPFFHYNEVPRYLRVNNSLKRQLYFQKANYSKKSISYNLFDGYFPTLIDKKEPLNKKLFFYSASHRTFTNTSMPYYFKIDIPYRISSSNRILTRNKNRLKASELSVKYIERYSENMGLWYIILADIEFQTNGNSNLVVRKKYKYFTNVPLFSLTSDVPFNNKITILEYIMKEANEDNAINFVMNKIIEPIINVFFDFLNISIKHGDGKLIMPSDFHSQNVNVLLDQNNHFHGLSFQDLDMSLELNKYNVSSEYDFCIGEFIFKPIEDWLYNNECITKEEFRERIKFLFKKYSLRYEQYFDEKGIFRNLLSKDIEIDSGDQNKYICVNEKLYR
ncbi:hypothetical protein KJJ36_14205 [Staphylococcus pseudoxylosus]|uniref:hypothetical protein n=1 Tax=Staphylococcus pseudoxylosus TaxID=2282419 RepID=UPI001F2EBC9C|nr:hypothetical protein [Staphylococcus pseudoxylosus]MCE5003521.1 hypothetical protein [Staphylococcus pseudoxylosus]